MPLAVGDPAPEFTLPDAEGRPISLSQLRGQRVVLYFYPRDNTPGCTKEACGFRDTYADYRAHGIQILGVSPDDARSHQKFAQKLQLPFPLLVDEGAKVATAYGVYGPKKFMGKVYNGVHRTTFVIDPAGKIEAVITKVKVETHAAELLKQLTGS
ncbi:thioredoxin-dependent thiol peroxidase [Synechococcus sp. R65.1]|uniref:thioredoxin-dependent thiol peroxidase n=1 Tax=unclassified Synechococcus TaxID=2626047 RepID=UPI0039C39555